MHVFDADAVFGALRLENAKTLHQKRLGPRF
jgi:hypothetical protein